MAFANKLYKRGNEIYKQHRNSITILHLLCMKLQPSTIQLMGSVLQFPI